MVDILDVDKSELNKEALKFVVVVDDSVFLSEAFVLASTELLPIVLSSDLILPFKDERMPVRESLDDEDEEDEAEIAFRPFPEGSAEDAETDGEKLIFDVPVASNDDRTVLPPDTDAW